MQPPEQLSLGVVEPATADDLVALRERLRALVDGRESRKAAWEMLRDAGLTDASLTTFYSRTRARGLDAVLAAMLVPERVAAARTLLQNPPAPRPPRVAVSTLANQFYCEMQVHLGTVHDVRVVSAEMAAGSAGHARFEAEAEPITDAEIARRIAAGESMGLVEMPLGATLEGVELVGRADRVQLQGAQARLVLEFKFSGRRDLYPSHVAQVQAYATLLAQRGLDTHGLVHAVAVVPRGVAFAPGFADQLAGAALELAGASPFDRAPTSDVTTSGAPDPLAGLRVRRASTDALGLWVFPHDPEAAARTLGWAFSYWRGERPPVPTTVGAKCRACPHNAAGLCNAAAAPPDGRYVAREVDGKRGKLHLLSPTRG